MESEGLFIERPRRKRPSERIDELNTESGITAPPPAPPQKRVKRHSQSDVATGVTRLPPCQQTIVLVENERERERDKRATMQQASALRVHTHFQAVPPHIFIVNCLAVSQLAAYLYLDAMTVTQCCFYWLSEYSNKSVAPHLLFNDCVEGLLSHLPVLEINSQYGLRFTQADQPVYCNRVRVAGSPLHQIPDAHFALRLETNNTQQQQQQQQQHHHHHHHPNHALFKGLAYVTQPLNKCFLHVYTPGSRTEFQADHFLYNTVLEEFFEPSFLIIALYHHALDTTDSRLVSRLFSGYKVPRSLVDYAQNEVTLALTHRVHTMIQPLRRFLEQVTPLVRHTFTPQEEDGCSPTPQSPREDDEYDQNPPLAACIDRADHNRIVKLRRLFVDLMRLANLLDDHRLDYAAMQRELKALYTEKADYCAAEMALRMETILVKLQK